MGHPVPLVQAKPMGLGLGCSGNRVFEQGRAWPGEGSFLDRIQVLAGQQHEFQKRWARDTQSALQNVPLRAGIVSRTGGTNHPGRLPVDAPAAAQVQTKRSFH